MYRAINEQLTERITISCTHNWELDIKHPQIKQLTDSKEQSHLIYD
jgi:hypothetical protein